MPDHPFALRLSDVVPSRVALWISATAFRRVERGTKRLGVEMKLPAPQAGTSKLEEGLSILSQSEMYRAARALAEWAKTGEGPVEMMGALLAEVREDLGMLSLAELAEEVRLVLLAAEARLALAAGRPVTATEVAMLAGRDERTIRAAAAANTLTPIGRGRPMRFAAGQVRAYLYACGVMAQPREIAGDGSAAGRSASS